MIENKLSQIEEAVNDAEMKRARELLSPILHNDPNNKDALYWLALTCDYEHHVDCLQKVLELDPENTRARKQLQKTVHEPMFTVQEELVPQPLENQQVYLSNSFRILFLGYFEFHILFAFMFSNFVDSLTSGRPFIGNIAGLLYLLVALLLVLYSRSRLWQIELDANFLSGPMKIDRKWVRVKVPLNQINVHRSHQTKNRFGYYSICTMSGREIRLMSFRHQQVLKILSFIRARKARYPVPLWSAVEDPMPE